MKLGTVRDSVYLIDFKIRQGFNTVTDNSERFKSYKSINGTDIEIDYGNGTKVQTDLLLINVTRDQRDTLNIYLRDNINNYIPCKWSDDEAIFGPMYLTGGNAYFVKIIDYSDEGEASFSQNNELTEYNLVLQYIGPNITDGYELGNHDALITVEINNTESVDYMVADATERAALSPDDGETAYQEDNLTIYRWSEGLSVWLSEGVVDALKNIMINESDYGLKDGRLNLSLRSTYTHNGDEYKTGLIKSFDPGSKTMDLINGPSVEHLTGFSFSIWNGSRFWLWLANNNIVLSGCRTSLVFYTAGTPDVYTTYKTGFVRTLPMSHTDYNIEVEPKNPSSYVFPSDTINETDYPLASSQFIGKPVMHTYGRFKAGLIQAIAFKTESEEVTENNVDMSAISEVRLSGVQTITFDLDKDDFLPYSDVEAVPSAYVLVCVASSADSGMDGEEVEVESVSGANLTVSGSTRIPGTGSPILFGAKYNTYTIQAGSTATVYVLDRDIEQKDIDAVTTKAYGANGVLKFINVYGKVTFYGVDVGKAGRISEISYDVNHKLTLSTPEQYDQNITEFLTFNIRRYSYLYQIDPESHGTFKNSFVIDKDYSLFRALKKDDRISFSVAVDVNNAGFHSVNSDYQLELAPENFDILGANEISIRRDEIKPVKVSTQWPEAYQSGYGPYSAEQWVTGSDSSIPFYNSDWSYGFGQLQVKRTSGESTVSLLGYDPTSLVSPNQRYSNIVVETATNDEMYSDDEIIQNFNIEQMYLESPEYIEFRGERDTPNGKNRGRFFQYQINTGDIDFASSTRYCRIGPLIKYSNKAVGVEGEQLFADFLVNQLQMIFTEGTTVNSIKSLKIIVFNKNFNKVGERYLDVTLKSTNADYAYYDLWNNTDSVVVTLQNNPELYGGDDDYYNADATVIFNHLQPITNTDAGGNYYTFEGKDLFPSYGLNGDEVSVFFGMLYNETDLLNMYDASGDLKSSAFGFGSCGRLRIGFGDVITDDQNSNHGFDEIFVNNRTSIKNSGEPELVQYTRIDGGKLAPLPATYVIDTPRDHINDVLGKQISSLTNAVNYEDSEESDRVLHLWRYQYTSPKTAQDLMALYAKNSFSNIVYDGSGDIVLRSADILDHGLSKYEFTDYNTVSLSVAQKRKYEDICQEFIFNYSWNPVSNKYDKRVRVYYDSGLQVEGLESQAALALKTYVEDLLEVCNIAYKSNNRNVLEIDLEMLYHEEFYKNGNVIDNETSVSLVRDKAILETVRRYIQNFCTDAWEIELLVKFDYFVHYPIVGGDAVLKQGDKVSVNSYHLTGSSVDGLISGIYPDYESGLCKCTVLVPNPPGYLGGITYLIQLIDSDTNDFIDSDGNYLKVRF